MTELPHDVRHFFIAAGWHVGRRVTIPSEVPSNHPAAVILSEFSGLTVGQTGAGEECATSDVEFRPIWPDDGILDIWGGLLKTRLIGVAEYYHRHGELYVDDYGRWFAASLMDDTFCFEGDSFSEAMERLLLGRRCRPMLRPDQSQVSSYGEVFSSDDPRVYKY
jgi:hypothetical protein